MEKPKPLSEDVLRKLINPSAMALSKPGGVEKIMEDVDPNEYNDFSDDMFLAETYNEDAGAGTVSSAYTYDPEAAQILAARRTTDYSSNNFNPERLKSSKVLSAIKEDLIKHPIDTAALNTQMIESAGGGNPGNNDRLAKMVARAKQVDAKAGELDGRGMTRSRNNGVKAETVGAAPVDYALIKTIIRECIEEKFNEMAERGLLNEGATLKGIGLSEGKIKLVDNKGNVFSAKLEYKGNTKEKK